MKIGLAIRETKRFNLLQTSQWRKGSELGLVRSALPTPAREYLWVTMYLRNHFLIVFHSVVLFLTVFENQKI